MKQELEWVRRAETEGSREEEPFTQKSDDERSLVNKNKIAVIATAGVERRGRGMIKEAGPDLLYQRKISVS